MEAECQLEWLEFRSDERRGLDVMHMGSTVVQLEWRGIQTSIRKLKQDIKAANQKLSVIRKIIRSLLNWIETLMHTEKELLEED